MMDSTTAFWKKLLGGGIACSVAVLVPALAQEPVIIVDIKAVANQVARNIDAEESQLPLTVQVPLHVAADVCEVPPTVLGMQGSSGGAAGCAATTTSNDLEEIVEALLRKESRAQ